MTNQDKMKEIQEKAREDVLSYDDLRSPGEFIDRGVVHNTVRCFYCSTIIAVSIMPVPPVACIDCVLDRRPDRKKRGNGQKVDQLLHSE